VNDEVTETPTGETTIVPGPDGLPTITPQVERTFPIRNIKLLTEAKKAFADQEKAEQQMTQVALTLLGIVAQAPELLKEVNDLQTEAKRLGDRIVADTGGKVKSGDVIGFNFTNATIVLKQPNG